jgi:hypothetical protein
LEASGLYNCVFWVINLPIKLAFSRPYGCKYLDFVILVWDNITTGAVVSYRVCNLFRFHSGNEFTDNAAKLLLCTSWDNVENLGKESRILFCTFLILNPLSFLGLLDSSARQ